MPADRSGEPGDRPDEPGDQAGGNGRSDRAGGAEAEPRSRQEYYVALRVAVVAEESVTAREAAAEDQAASEKWDQTKEDSGWMWTEYQRRFPLDERPQVNRPGDGLNRAPNERVEAACDRTAALERDEITPAMRAIESQDPDRHLQRHQQPVDRARQRGRGERTHGATPGPMDKHGRRA